MLCLSGKQGFRSVFFNFFYFIYSSTCADGLAAAQICISDMYVKFIVSAVTSATSGQLKRGRRGKQTKKRGKKIVSIFVCMYVCVMGGGVGHGVIFLPP